MVAFSRFALLAVVALSSAQSLSGSPAGGPGDSGSGGVAIPSDGAGGSGESGQGGGEDYAQPTGQFDRPRPTGMPTPGDDSSDNQDLAAGPQDPPYPKGKSPTDGPEGVARPTGKRGRKHRGGKKHRSGGVAAPTGVPPPPPPSDALPTGMPSASPPSPEKRQNRMTNGARLRSRKHKKPSKTPGAGVAPPSGARPTGARPSKAKPTKAKPSKTKGSGKSMEPTVTPPAELPRRRDSGNAEAHQPLAVALL